MILRLTNNILLGNLCRNESDNNLRNSYGLNYDNNYVFNSRTMYDECSIHLDDCCCNAYGFDVFKYMYNKSIYKYHTRNYYIKINYNIPTGCLYKYAL